MLLDDEVVGGVTLEYVEKCVDDVHTKAGCSGAQECVFEDDKGKHVSYSGT